MIGSLSIRRPRPPLRGPEALTWYVRFFRDPVRCMRMAYKRHGPVTAMGNVLSLKRREKLHVLALGPEFNRMVLGHPEDFRNTGQTLRGPKGSALRRLRHGLTRMTGEKHKEQRRIIAPAFMRDAVRGYAGHMTRIVDEVLSDWRAGDTVNLWGQMRRLSLRLSSRLLFGVEEGGRADRLAGMIQELFRRNFSTGVWLFPVPHRATPYGRLLRYAEEVEREILALLDEKRRGSGSRDVFGMLVKEPMSDEDLVGQATILFGASYETAVNALTWTLFLIAQHPHVAQRLLDELPDELSFDRLSRLPYLEASIKEAMRVLPPVPFTIRAVMRREAWLGDVRVKNGDRVVVSHYVTHHLPELYPEPECYRPERWEAITPSQYEYLPFSAGPRACIGSAFAMAEMKIAVATVMKRWRLEVVPGTRIDRAVRVTLTPREPLMVRLHAQDGRFAASPVRGQIHEMVRLA